MRHTLLRKDHLVNHDNALGGTLYYTKETSTRNQMMLQYSEDEDEYDFRSLERTARPLRAGLLYSRHDKNTIAIVVLIGIKLCWIARAVLNDHVSHHNSNICIMSCQKHLFGVPLFLWRGHFG